jgi:hypothetical protein
MASSKRIDEDVELAVKGLSNAVSVIYRKYERRRSKSSSTNLPELSTSQRRRIDHITQHMQHCLNQLLHKQESLQTGFRYLRSTVWPSMLQRQKQCQHFSITALTSDLTHFFTQLLRLHDGLILLVSGECRHAGDSAAATAETNKFPSQLATGQHDCADGYTRLYSQESTYSGFGWDEFMDSNAGLQQRLLKLLKPLIPSSQRDDLWDTLTETGAAGLEALLSTLEVTMHEIQHDFVSFTEQVTTELTMTLQKQVQQPAKVTVQCSLADKLEKLRVTVRTHVFQLERRASAFQVTDPRGVLPTTARRCHNKGIKSSKGNSSASAATAEWARIMDLPELKEEESAHVAGALGNETTIGGAAGGALKKKRRLVIQDSDDEGNDDSAVLSVNNNQKEKKNSDHRQRVPDAGSGLVVRVVQAQTRDTKAEHSTATLQLSLRDIKLQMGVDVDGLAAALDGLEAEEAGASRAAAVIDSAPTDFFMDSSSEQHEIQLAEFKVKKRKGVLNKVIMRDIPDDNEVWDAREGLREALMTAGNSLLWATSSLSKKRPEELKTAIRYFGESKDLVQQQEKLHAKMTRESGDFSSASHFYRRNLLLLRGQAHTNMGITMIECSRQLNEQGGERKVYLRGAIKELEIAQECAQTMKSHAEVDNNEGSGSVETMLDVLRAQQLESLLARWMGTAYWRQGRRKESVDIFERGAVDIAEAQCSQNICDEDLFEAELQLRAESYYSCTALADLASGALECSPRSSQSDVLAKYDELLLIATKALDRAVSISETIQVRLQCSRTGGTFEAFQHDHEVMEAKALRRSREEIRDWWQRRKAAFQPIFISNGKPSSLPRNDIFADGPLRTEATPKLRFVVSEGSRRQKKKKKDGGFSSGLVGYSTNGVNAPNFDGGAARVRQPRQYRKWGDELLLRHLDESTEPGRSVPNRCPSTAPDMPSDIIAILERRKSSV